MITKNMETAINEQINKEFSSSYLYLSMAAWFDSTGLKGAAAWMHAQAEEEKVHAMKFYHFIEERRAKVELTAIEGPKTSWNSPLHAFEDAFAHEEYISGRINKLMTLAREVRDYATEELLHWFVKEQVEEEASVDEVVQKLKMLGDARNGLLMLDKELGKRD